MVNFQSSLFLQADAETAYKLFTDELQISFLKQGFQIDFHLNGKISRESEILGVVKELVENSKITIEWISPDPLKQGNVTIEISFDEHKNGTVILFDFMEIDLFLGVQESESIGWYVDELLTPMFKKLEPNTFGDWLTDRATRKPSGPNARQVYSDPLYHWPNFFVLLEKMNLSSSDMLLEIGCGGGILMREALKSGCKAKAIDHSPEMVKLARKNNAKAIEDRKLEILLSDAENLPFNDNFFTQAVTTGVFQFIPHPDIAMKEIYRSLKLKGKFFMYGGSKEMKVTIAAQEPYASRLKFFDKAELEDLAKNTGFSEVQILQPDLREYARKAGIDEENLWLFESKYSLLLIAQK